MAPKAVEKPTEAGAPAATKKTGKCMYMAVSTDHSSLQSRKRQELIILTRYSIIAAKGKTSKTQNKAHAAAKATLKGVCPSPSFPFIP